MESNDIGVEIVDNSSKITENSIIKCHDNGIKIHSESDEIVYVHLENNILGDSH
jgi:hypothetical protein